MGVVYLKLGGFDPSSSPERPPTRSHDIDSSPSGTGAVSLQGKKLPTAVPISRDIPRLNEPTLPLNQSLFNTKPASIVPPNLLTARQSSSNPSVISLTDFRPVTRTRTDTSFPPSTAFVSPSGKDVHPPSITQRSYDTSPPPASNEEPPTAIVLGNVGTSSVTTVTCHPVTIVAGHPAPTKHMMSPGLIPRFRRSKGVQSAPSFTHLPARIAGSLLSTMELFQGLPSADSIFFATLTITPKRQTSRETSEADDMSYHYASYGQVVEFQNTREAAQAIIHHSLEKTLSVGVLLDALISLDAETTKKGGKPKPKFGRFSWQVHTIH